MRLIWSALLMLLFASVPAFSQEQAHYSGTTLSNPYRHDGGLSPVIGVHNIQTMRADRSQSGSHEEWTYNHQPMISSWQGRLWLHYLSDPQSEHVPPSRTLMQTSDDNGESWSDPQVLFPIYPNDGRTPDSVASAAVMHQRVGWYISSEKSGQKLLALGHYGICPTPKDDPNDGNGIGRVVREVHEDGSLGEIYFLYYNHDYGEKNTAWPLYTRSKDKKFRQACEEILADPLMWMQMVEECDRNDARLPLTNTYKAFCYYPLEDGSLVGFWKHALTSRSLDGGRTWSQPVQRAKGFVNSNAKIWGQRLPDGSYTAVYNPAEFRWPLALSTSVDGLNYTTLNLINGEVPPMRYGGNYKSYGPQYTRGVQPSTEERNGQFTTTDRDTSFVVAYSMNKEDIWVSTIPVPIRTQATHYAEPWNIYSPKRANVTIIANDSLLLEDGDPYDYAKAERVLPETRKLSNRVDIVPAQNTHGRLEIEITDKHGQPCTRIAFTADKQVLVKVGARWNTILSNYEPGHCYHLTMDVSLDTRSIELFITDKTAGGKPKHVGPKMLYAPIEKIARLVFRTGEMRLFPTPETPADNYEDLPAAGCEKASWEISNILCDNHLLIDGFYSDYIPNKHWEDSTMCHLLNTSKLNRYVDFFNMMEDENIVQAIPNSEAAAWMAKNVPLFECPDKQVEEIYYYRWWTLRKHLKQTPAGWAMTEFLVQRSYADQYNLIASALGHHIMESRWLRNRDYLDGVIKTWLRGNFNPETGGDNINGGPMKRIDTFSSWLPYAIGQYDKLKYWLAYDNDGHRIGATDMEGSSMEIYHKDLEALMARYDSANLYLGETEYPGLYWQKDVKDAMEESISGGRKVKNRRPSINAYMLGNRQALAEYDAIAYGNASERKASVGESAATTLAPLWDEELQFYTSLCENDSLAQVRELIGYLPWYFNLPEDDSAKYKAAWMQLLDKKGFDAPSGMTTAEQRHPLFRKKMRPGKPTCEWDGAVWPFATSQTLTALINLENNYPQLSAALPDTLFWHHFRKYTQSQYFHGRPYIGEYLDETTGYWLMGDRERSRYYNHSSYCDLVITGLCGLVPEDYDEGKYRICDGASFSLNPLAPQEWDWWCVDGILYKGCILTILYDRYGNHYHQGKGLRVLVNGRPKAPKN